MNESMISRRWLLRESGLGLGTVALAQLLSGAPRKARMDLTPRPAAFEPRAKAVIQLVQNGGPSRWTCSTPSRS